MKRLFWSSFVLGAATFATSVACEGSCAIESGRYFFEKEGPPWPHPIIEGGRIDIDLARLKVRIDYPDSEHFVLFSVEPEGQREDVRPGEGGASVGGHGGGGGAH